MKNGTRRSQELPFRNLAIAGLAIFVFAVVAAGGCSSSSTQTIVTHSPTPSSVSPTPTPSMSPTPTPSPTPTAVNFVVMAYASVPPTTDPTYGQIDGFGLATSNPTSTPLPKVVSQVINVHCNQTIAFYNLDRLAPHTASLLNAPTPGPPGPSASWPPFNNANGTTATNQFTAGQLTPITYLNFSTGLLLPYGSGLSTSFVYSTGPAAGVFFFEDQWQYTLLSNPAMRTAINVICP